MVSHSLKNSSESINGILVSDSSDSPKKLRITDAIPLSHLSISLAARADISLQQVSLYLKKANLHLAGFYVAYSSEAMIASNYLSPSSTEFVNLLSSMSSNPLIIIKLEIPPPSTKSSDTPPLFKAFSLSDKSQLLTQIPLNGFESSEIQSVPFKLSLKDHNNIYDFDDHLDNTSLDWLQNLQYNSLLSKY
ncbi:hypothetical protein BB560_006357 [Smittium megazygosporum]|uniref:MPN domain-containing protein n=1 Tax=Smittium megazygosporum TaxID=133381 RepID=A0A2T9Y8F1_9FUNG|nr:hypothetical protein BB560_006357 [Smittium megazygosporum]